MTSWIYNLYKRLFKDRTEAAIFLAVFLVEIAFGLFLMYKWGFTFSCQDDVLHLYKARVVIDNGAQSGLVNLGVEWLPLIYILTMPLVLINPLYTTGFAGTIVNALVTGAICVTLPKLFEEKSLKAVAIILFLCNGFTLVYGSVPMNEQLVLLFLVLGAYYFKRYCEGDEVIEFLKCSLALILGTLSRYEVWPVALLAVFFFIIRELKNGQKHRLAYAHFPLWGIFACLFLNVALFRDPLWFIHHTPTFGGSPLPGAGSIQLATLLTIEALNRISGFLWLAIIPSLLLLLISKRNPKFIVASLLMVPIAMHWLLSYTIFGIVSPGFTRYFYMGYAGLVVAPLLVLDGNRRLRKKVIKFTVIGILFFALCFSYPFQIKILETGVQPKYDQPSAESSDGYFAYVVGVKEMALKIKDVAGDSTVMYPYDSRISARLSVFTGMSPAMFYDPYDGQIYAEAMVRPWDSCDYVIIGKNGTLLTAWNNFYKSRFGTGYYEWLYYNDPAWKTVFSKHYTLISTIDSILIFERGAP